jgi:serine O-acetyltransferase
LITYQNGTVIYPKAVIAPNCLIYQQVIIGSRGGGISSIGGHVDIGAGAKVIGDVHRADHARIGVSSVVLEIVLEGAIALGIPAIINNKIEAKN